MADKGSDAGNDNPFANAYSWHRTKAKRPSTGQVGRPHSLLREKKGGPSRPASARPASARSGPSGSSRPSSSRPSSSRPSEGGYLGVGRIRPSKKPEPKPQDEEITVDDLPNPSQSMMRDPDDTIEIGVAKAVAKRPRDRGDDVKVAPNDTDEISKLKTAEDTIAFLSSQTSSATSVKFVYLNRTDEPLRFRPYDLEVVMRGDEHPEHFVISATGVVHVKPEQPSEVMYLSEWMRESTLFNVLTRINFFKWFLLGKAFTQWRRNVRFKLYCLTRKKLSRKLFVSKQTFAPSVFHLHQQAYDLSTYEMMCVPMLKTDFLLHQFKEVQQTQRESAGVQFLSVVDRMESKLSEICEDLTQRTNVPDFQTMESLEQYLLAQAGEPRGRHKKMQAMVDAKVEQMERMKTLKRSMFEFDMLNHFIRLVDYMAAENLFRNCLMAIKSFCEVLRLPFEKKMINFQISLSFSGDERFSFVPSRLDVQVMIDQLAEDLIQQVASVPRLLHIFRPGKEQTFSLSNVIRKDFRYNALRATIGQIFDNDFHEASLNTKVYEAYRLWFVFVEEEWPAEFARWERIDLKAMMCQDLMFYLRKVRHSSAEVEKIFNRNIGSLVLNAQKLRNELMPAMQAILKSIHGKIIEVARARTISLQTSLTSKTKALVERPQVLRGFAAFVTNLKEIESGLTHLMDDAREVEVFYEVTHENHIPVPHEDTARKEEVVGTTSTVSQACQKDIFLENLQGAKDFMTSNMKNMANHLDVYIDGINEDLLATMAVLNSGDFVNPNSDPREVLSTLQELSQSVGELSEKADLYSGYQRLFELPSAEWTNLLAMKSLWAKRKEVWELSEQWNEKRHIWGSTIIDQLDVAAMNEEVKEFYNNAFRMNRAMKDEVSAHLLEAIKEEKQYMPIITHLGNKAMRKEHWQQIFAGMQKPFALDRGYTLDGLRTWKIFDYKTIVEDQSEIATGEHHLQLTIDKIKATWDNISFQTVLHRDYKDTYIIESVDEIIETLEEHQVQLQACLTSKYVSGIRQRVEEWDKRLGAISEVIEALMACQKLWVWMEFIFSSEDVKRQLAAQSKKFQQVDKDFRDVTRKAHHTGRVLTVCLEPGVYDSLQSYNTFLDELQSKLEDYLDTKRAAFPRFYFLAHDDLLNMMSDVRTPSSVQAHLYKCFDGIRSLKFKSTAYPGSHEITGMVNAEGELLPFTATVTARGSLETWLGLVEAMMQTSIFDHLKATQQGAWEGDREAWIFQHPTQCIQIIDQVMWVKETESALERTDRGGLKGYLDFYLIQVEKTIQLTTQATSATQRLCVASVITLSVHSRDVLLNLLKTGVNSVKAFDWVKNLRYSWEQDNLAARMAWARYNYAYEFLGSPTRLVLTPLTDRAYMTCSAALSMHLGAVVQGPTGVGKTETIKDLGKALGRHTVVFSCSADLSRQFMVRMFCGMVQAGSWACFDEFDRMSIETLSIMGQHISDVASAISMGLRQMLFEGFEIALHPNHGLFMTMAPQGYSINTPLPDSLKECLRPVALMVPDVGMIAHVILTSEGFRNAKSLASKLVNLYEMASEQMGQFGHYFGLRAIKSTLSAAASIKPCEPNLSEEALLLRTIRDMSPKLPEEEYGRFEALVAEFFPEAQAQSPKAVNSVVIEQIKQALAGMNYDAPPRFLKLIAQLHDTITVGRAVMLIGGTFTGKSTCWKALQDALLALRKIDPLEPAYVEVQADVVNPKSITTEELYGEIHSVTREWTDGILANLIKNRIKSKKKKLCNWIVLDGPMDPTWAETSILDGNQTLCLVSGQKIHIPSTMSFLFELEELRHASPAVVSRCGMIHFSSESLDGGWLPIFNHYYRKCSTELPDAWDPAQQLKEWVDHYMESCLMFRTKHCRQSVITTDSHTVESFMILLAGFISRLEMSDDERKEVEGVERLKPEDEEELELPDTPTSACSNESTKEPCEEKSEDELPELPAVDMEVDKAFAMYFIQALTWSVGGSIISEDRAAFDEHVRELMQTHPGPNPYEYPKDLTIFDYYTHKSSLTFAPWSRKIPKLVFDPEGSLQNMFVPTSDTVAYHTTLTALLTQQKSTLLTAESGAGKTHMMREFLADVCKVKYGDLSYVTLEQTFNGYTTSSHVLAALYSRLRKRKGGLRALLGQHLVFFPDDVSVAAPDDYGTCSVLELMRQILDQRTVLDPDKVVTRNVEDLTIMATCMPARTRHIRSTLSSRLTSKFFLLTYPDATDVSIKKIFSTILGKMWRNRNYPDSILIAIDGIMDASLEVYDWSRANLKPTPTQCHYTFGVHDLSKVFNGLLNVSYSAVPDYTSMTRLWIHENARVYHDRLMDAKDRDAWWDAVARSMKKKLMVEWDPQMRHTVFADFSEKGQKAEYKPYYNRDELKTILVEFMVAYDIACNKDENVVFFDAAICHLVQLIRILRQRFGHAMLVGSSGSGRQTLLNLAAWIVDMKVVGPCITKGYGIREFRQDLLKAVYNLGVEESPLVFMMQEADILQESFLADLNSLLGTGEVPELILADDYERIISTHLERNKLRGKDLSREDIKSGFRQKCRDDIHVALLLSPTSDKFRDRLRMFPTLVNAMTIDWYLPWTESALGSVAFAFFQRMPGVGEVESTCNAMCSLCAYMHSTIQDATQSFYLQSGWKVYHSPNSFFQLLNVLETMLKEYSKRLKDQIHRLKGGLDNLMGTSQLVEDIEKDLDEMRPSLVKSTEEASRLLEQLRSQQKRAAEARVLRIAEEKETKIMRDEAIVIREEVKKSLAQNALPPYNQACEAIKTISKKDLDELKSFTTPPPKIKIAIDPVLLLLRERPGWDQALKVLSDPNFFQRLVNYDKENVSDMLAKKIQRWIKDEQFQPENVKKVNNACYVLCLWVRAVDNYDKICKSIAPKRDQLAKAEDKLATAMTRLRTRQEDLASIENKVMQVQHMHAATLEKINNLTMHIKAAEMRLQRATKLLAGLGEERARWNHTVQSLESKLGTSLGNVTLAAGCVAYLGAFPATYRGKLKQKWVAACLKLHIAADPEVDTSFFMEETTIRSWGLKGLPLDPLSIENAIISQQSRRWPVIIDPMGQAGVWIRDLEEEKGLRILKMDSPSLGSALEDCLAQGVPVIIEEVNPNKIDATLNVILQKKAVSRPGKLAINFGSQLVDYDPHFKLYFILSQIRPQLPPEDQTWTTLIDFTISPKGLEDELLTQVMNYEAQDMASSLNMVIMQIADSKGEAKSVDDRILSLLGSSSGAILDNEVLVIALSQSKKTAIELQEDLKSKESRKAEFESVKGRYQPVAERAAILYSVFISLQNINPMYIYTFTAFKNLMFRIMGDTPKSDSVEQRIQYLLDAMTLSGFNTLCLGVFEKDRMAFAFLLAGAIFRHQGAIKEIEWDHFFHPMTISFSSTTKAPTCLTPEQWDGVRTLHHLGVIISLDSLYSQPNEWTAWLASPKPHIVQPPLNHSLSVWQFFLVVNTLRPEMLVPMAHTMVKHYLGEEYVQPQPFNMLLPYEEATPYRPVILVFSPGGDPVSVFDTLATQENMENRKRVISMGQGQGARAEETLESATAVGDWVLIQNCHVAIPWMSVLQGIIEKFQDEEIHPEFRLWLTTAPCPQFPPWLLQNGLVLVKEPPKGIRGTMKQMLALNITEEVWLSSSNPNEWKKVLFALMFAHGVMLERRRYGALGWCNPYDWCTLDFQASLTSLQLQLEVFGSEGPMDGLGGGRYLISWDILPHVIGDIHYGGRVGDPMDQRLLSLFIAKYINPQCLEPNYSFTLDGAYTSPTLDDYEGLVAHVEALPLHDEAEVFGLHDTADMLVTKQQSKALMSTLTLMSTKGLVGTEKERDLEMRENVRNLRQRLPETLTIKSPKANLRAPVHFLKRVLATEVDIFNATLVTIGKSLDTLLSALEGDIVISRELEVVREDISLNKVPSLWMKSVTRPLASWMDGLKDKAVYLQSWIRAPPPTYLLGYHAMPHAILSATLQAHAKKNKIPIDSLRFRALVLDQEDVDADTTGLTLEGLSLECAAWDSASVSLEECSLGTGHSIMPPIWLECVRDTEPAPDPEYHYLCPVYHTSSRNATHSGLHNNLLLTVHLPCTKHQPSHWVFRGVALVCSQEGS